MSAKMMKAYQIKFIILILLLLLNPHKIFAGACMEKNDTYLDILTTADINDTNLYTNRAYTALRCLYHWVNYLVMGYEYFATPKALKRVERMTRPYRERVYGIVPRFLDSEIPLMRRYAINALAYYRWSKSFEYLAQNADNSLSERCVLFAILGDKRAIPLVMEMYREVDKKYRSHPQFSYPEKMNCLNALFHLASPNILPFIDSVIGNPRPSDVKERAEKVRQRILELYPNSNE